MGGGLGHGVMPLLPPSPTRASGRGSRQRPQSAGAGADASGVDSRRKCLASVVGVSALAICCGCATSPSSPASDLPVGRRVIAVIPAGQGPSPTIGPGPPRRPATSGELALGAATGAGAVALGALAIANPFLAGQGVLLLLQGLGAVAGTAVAAAGDGSGSAAESPQVTIEQALDSALVGLPLADLSAEAAVVAIRAFTPHRAEIVEDPGASTANGVPRHAILQKRGFTHVLEIRIAKAGIDLLPEIYSLGVIGEARLIDTSTGATAWTKGLFYSAPGRSADYLLRDQAAPARREFQRAARVLGERAAESLLLGAETTAPWFSSTTCGLVVIEPAPMWPGFASVSSPPGERAATVGLIGPSPVGSLTPVLTWEPTPQALPGGTNPWASAADIRYDLRVWNSDGEVPKDLAYERVGLAEARHEVETPLAPGSVYFWSVRVRAMVAGHLRSTPWSMAKYPEFARAMKVPSGSAQGEARQLTCASYTCGCLDFIPPANFYRFRTP